MKKSVETAVVRTARNPMQIIMGSIVTVAMDFYPKLRLAGPPSGSAQNEPRAVDRCWDPHER